MAKIVERGCGCEDMPPESGCEDMLFDWTPVSFCPTHQHQAPLIGGPPEKLYRCGECGFLSRQWERLERHVYRVHLGVRCG